MNAVWFHCKKSAQKWLWKFNSDTACFVFTCYFSFLILCACGGIFGAYSMDCHLGLCVFVGEIVGIAFIMLDAISEPRPFADIFKYDHWFDSPRKLEGVLDVWVAYKNYKWIVRDFKSGQEISIVASNKKSAANQKDVANVKKGISDLHFQRVALHMFCANEFSEDSLFHKDYLPRDMFFVILGQVYKELHKTNSLSE